MLRKATHQLVSWKARSNGRVMIVRGARRTGKTFIVNDFA